jgi:hypothetical protein
MVRMVMDKQDERHCARRRPDWRTTVYPVLQVLPHLVRRGTLVVQELTEAPTRDTDLTRKVLLSSVHPKITSQQLTDPLKVVEV